MRPLKKFLVAIAVTTCVSALGSVAHGQAVKRYRPPVAHLEVSENEPMPPGFGVQPTDVDGPVFTDARGMTLYTWPYHDLELGEAGDHPGKASRCTDVKTTVTAGLYDIYPAGLILPDLDIRPSCLQAWPAVLAAADAKPVGKFTIIARDDGRRQWAYDGLPLYTSYLDTRPGQVNGGMSRLWHDGDHTPPFRVPVGPAPAVPPAFKIVSIATGRILTTISNGQVAAASGESIGHVIYSSSADRPNVSNCKGECLKEWLPVLAAQAAQPTGEWGVIERSPGVKQWTFRKMPVYTYAFDRIRTILGERATSLIGNDTPGWSPVYAQKWPDPPKEFTVQDSVIGQVLADENGKTLYMYFCADDASDQLSCDHPSQTQVYRLAICGRGDPAACKFPYVPAPKHVVVNNVIWGTAWIDPRTGHPAKPDQPGAIHVWTFRDRPIFTFRDDQKPGDAYGNAWGEANGIRNGFKAFYIRDDFFGLAS
jgi:predicted lipoprotein with Yx(FWY)xxD motif